MVCVLEIFPHLISFFYILESELGHIWLRGDVRHHLAVILCSLIPIFVPDNSAWDNRNPSANQQHLDLLPVLPGTLPLPPLPRGGLLRHVSVNISWTRTSKRVPLSQACLKRPGCHFELPNSYIHHLLLCSGKPQHLWKSTTCGPSPGDPPPFPFQGTLPLPPLILWWVCEVCGDSLPVDFGRNKRQHLHSGTKHDLIAH